MPNQAQSPKIKTLGFKLFGFDLFTLLNILPLGEIKFIK